MLVLDHERYNVMVVVVFLRDHQALRPVIILTMIVMEQKMIDESVVGLLIVMTFLIQSRMFLLVAHELETILLFRQILLLFLDLVLLDELLLVVLR